MEEGSYNGEFYLFVLNPRGNQNEEEYFLLIYAQTHNKNKKED